MSALDERAAVTGEPLEARGVTVTRGGERILDGLSLTVPADARLLVEGTSGAGKSTLFRLLGLLDIPDEGAVYVDGEDASGLPERKRARIRRETIGFVFQEFELVPDLTAHENARLPQEHAGTPDDDDEAWLTNVFETLGIAGRRDRYPASLSGGERQRVAIARALANRPAVVLADEPTGQLDPDTTDDVIDLLVEARDAAGTALVVVSHDRQIADRFRDRRRLVDGRLRPVEAAGSPNPE
jgi:putative ABC transport system ATP-binding protein